MQIVLPNIESLEGVDWEVGRTMLADDMRQLQLQINRTWEVAHRPTGEQRTSGDGIASGTIIGTLNEQPTGLGARHSGLMFYVTDYQHWVRWTGANWQFADEGGGYIQDFAVTPQGTGWALCDGSGTTRLVVGGTTLTATAFTTPDLVGSGGAYRKGGATYNGTVNAAGSGTTGASGAHDHGGLTQGGTANISGLTASESSHTHGVTVSGTTGTATSAQTVVQAGTGATVAHQQHSHVISEVETTGAGSAHSHGVGTLAVDSHQHAIDAESDHTHSVPSVEPRHLVTLAYFRR